MPDGRPIAGIKFFSFEGFVLPEAIYLLPAIEHRLGIAITKDPIQNQTKIFALIMLCWFHRLFGE